MTPCTAGVQSIRLTKRSQGGSIILISTLFLLVLGLMAVALTESSLMQVQMSQKESARLQLKHEAMGLIDDAILRMDRASLEHQVNSEGCDDSDWFSSIFNCENTALVSDRILSSGDINVSIQDRGAITSIATIKALEQRLGSVILGAVRREIRVDIDRSRQSLGRVALIQGVVQVATATMEPPDSVLVSSDLNHPEYSTLKTYFRETGLDR
jgi:hypothetical protein